MKAIVDLAVEHLESCIHSCRAALHATADETDTSRFLNIFVIILFFPAPALVGAR